MKQWQILRFLQLTRFKLGKHFGVLGSGSDVQGYTVCLCNFAAVSEGVIGTDGAKGVHDAVSVVFASGKVFICRLPCRSGNGGVILEADAAVYFAYSRPHKGAGVLPHSAVYFSGGGGLGILGNPEFAGNQLFRVKVIFKPVRIGVQAGGVAGGFNSSQPGVYYFRKGGFA